MTGPLKDFTAAAEWLGIPEKTLRNLVSARKVPFTHPAGTRHVRFSEEHLNAMVAMGEEWPERGLRLVPEATHPPAGPATPPPQPRPRPATRRRSA